LSKPNNLTGNWFGLLSLLPSLAP